MLQVHRQVRQGTIRCFLELLALLFIGLKLTGHIDWSWVWVLSPLWVKASFALLMVAAAVSLKKKMGGKPSGET